MKNTALLRSLAAGALGIGLVVGLFYLTGVTLKHLGDLIARLYWPAFIGIVVLSYIYVVLGGMKWHIIAGSPPPRRFFYTYHTAQAMLIGQLLPLPVAIAANRAAVMKLRQNTPLKKGLLNAIYDMGFDFLAAATFIPASFLQLYRGFDFGTWLALGTGTVFVTAIVCMFAPKLIPTRWLSKMSLIEARKKGMLSPRVIGLMMLLSTLRFAITIIRLVLGAMAINLAGMLMAVTFATPPATLTALVALTPANLGIAEWGWTYLLTLWHIPAATGALYGVSFRILFVAAQMIVSVVCWALYSAKSRT